MDKPIMTPAPGERMLRFVGDRVRFSLRMPHGFPSNGRALLRTNLGKAERTRQEIINTHAGKNPMSVAFWRDIPLQPQPDGEWSIELPLTDVGFFRAKAYLIDNRGMQIWPDGPDAGISVHPDIYRTNNTIYCAFVRMFGESKTARKTIDEARDKELAKLDAQGYTVIPPSGKLRDVIKELPHIIDKLGCRILHLLPINPTPTVFARMGRFGSPYACLDLTSVDPELVEFDERTTGIEQFCELTTAAHRRGARVFLDFVINHTGWGSQLYENHPEWFLREPDGRFASPGAWGIKWGDLVELDPNHVELWEVLAQSFLTWCRRGVDGFRCDAGYKVPVQVWQYIEARVRQEFPDTLFLLEGLGGPLESTENLLTNGGMQWAYSELFQNYSPQEVAHYLDYSLRQSERVGVYVHYSETHDNNRLATGGAKWSLMRNSLSALASVAGGFGFTCGVEWLADEKVNVHSARGMSWGSETNIIDQLANINRLLAQHPCFFDGAKIKRVSDENSQVLALRRDSADGLDHVLVLVNTDVKTTQTLKLDSAIFEGVGSPRFDLLGQKTPTISSDDKFVTITLGAGDAYCLSATRTAAGLSGDEYRKTKSQAAFALSALSKVLLPEDIGPGSWRDLAERVATNPHEFLGSIHYIDRKHSRRDLLGALDAAKGKFPEVVTWSMIDSRRITPVPPNHWLLIKDSRPFRATLKVAETKREEHVESIEVRDGHIAFIAPRSFNVSTDADLELERYALTTERISGLVRFIGTTPVVSSKVKGVPEDAMVLLTNGRGGMARLCVDLGRIRSKYDCALGANLHPELPVDRHIFAKRIRVWVNANGFITALNSLNMVSFEMGPPAVWTFSADAGDGRAVEIKLTADMLDDYNTTVFRFFRPAGKSSELPSEFDVRLTVRVDIEDRNFHWETQRNASSEHHFASNCSTLDRLTGFEFTPDQNRQLRVVSTSGIYHPEPEWSEHVPHPIEASRGQTGEGDAYSPGWFELPLARGHDVSVVLSADIPPVSFDIVDEVFASRSVTNKLAVERAKLGSTDTFGRRLAQSARAFIVQRGTGDTVIAGYPWFLDWGRDTFISARGMLAAGMVADVAELLVVFGKFEENGTMPNTINGDNASNRDTSDAPLWYGVLCEEAAAQMDEDLYTITVDSRGRRIVDILRDIAINYARGTPNGIRMDSESGLIWSPAHFTWMDTNYPACTPREGYPVEIQVLWIRLLRLLEKLNAAPPGELWSELANRAEASLKKYFWLEKEGYICDLLIARAGQPASQAVQDNALRSNFLFAIAFGFFRGERARRAVDAAIRYLVVPGGLRSLAPLPVSPPLNVTGNNGQPALNANEPYAGHYEGDEDTRRKPAYHNGTAWTWTLPVLCEAIAKAWDNSPTAVAAAKAYLASMDHLLLSGCLGQIPEILDGDAPHTERGCDAQAWGVLEALRVWKQLNP
jgi:starch synthase (maltosyl-transferring)